MFQRWPSKVYAAGHEPDPRFSLANERTFLAWIRTALGVLAIGTAADAFAFPTHHTTRMVVIATCTGLAIAVAANALIRWARTEIALRRDQPLPGQGAAPILSVGLVIIGICVLVGISG